jgi:outer membrane lipoprotein carrier protein
VKLNSYIVIAILLSLTYAYSSVAEELEIVVDRIQKKYEEITDFHAKFTQEATVKALDKVQKSEGEVWFKKPGKMRWNYYTPEKDEIVSDGRTLWFYDVAEKQVIESPLAQVSDTQNTTSLLSGLGNIKEVFDASFADATELTSNGNYMLELKPKTGEEQYNKAIVAFDKDTMVVNSIYLYDPFGNLTTISLKDIEIDKGVQDSLFSFTVPSGVEVIRPPSAISPQ